MVRSLHKLTDTKVRALGKGRHSDGGGLYLRVSASGGKSWSFMFNKNNKRQEIGLGPYPAVSLSAARKIATEAREAVALGNSPERPSDPKEEHPTFAEAVEFFLASMEGQWSNPKHRAQWRMTLGPAYCKPILNRRVGDLGLDDVLRVLKPHWASKPETASRVRGRIERVLAFAKVKGWRSGENPAIWKGNLDAILPPRKRLTRGHMAAMPYAELPEFVSNLQASGLTSALALEFLILTASRSGEVLGAKWDEVDIEKAVWTIPAHRMKARKEHRVPLSPRTLEILTRLDETRLSDFVFPGNRKGSGQSNMTLTKLLRRMGRNETVHGMRSAFRDWAGDQTTFSREVAEAALAHSIGNATEQAYRRSDALEKRRELLTAWSNFLFIDASTNVVPLKTREVI
jgi:integrase